jgi:hypothetical protein
MGRCDRLAARWSFILTSAHYNAATATATATVTVTGVEVGIGIQENKT